MFTEWTEQAVRLHWIEMIGGVEVVEKWILQYADSGKVKDPQMLRWRLALDTYRKAKEA